MRLAIDGDWIEDKIPAVVYVALIAYLLGSSVYVRMSTATRLAYALCAAIALLVPMGLLLAGRRVTRRMARFAAAIAGVSGLFLVPAMVFPEGRTLQHVAIDLCTTLMPVGFFLTALLAPSSIRRILEPRWVALFFVISLYPPFIVQDPSGVRLFEPPSVGVMALVATLAIHGGKWARPAAGAGLALLVVLATLSGSRSIALLALLAFASSVFVNRTAQRIAGLVLVGALGASLLGLDLDVRRPQRGSWLQPAFRIVQLMSLTPAPSATRRLQEAEIAFADTEKRSAAWGFVGMGHGAVFEPGDWDRPMNISEEGFVHNIHVGPAMMTFRYGLLGIAVYLILAITATVAACRWFLKRRSGEVAVDLSFLYAFGVALFMIEFMVRNVLPNPVFSFFLSGYLAIALNRRNIVEPRTSPPPAPDRPVPGGQPHLPAP